MKQSQQKLIVNKHLIPPLAPQCHSQYQAYSKLQKTKSFLNDDQSIIGIDELFIGSVHENDETDRLLNSNLVPIQQNIMNSLKNDDQKFQWKLYITKSQLAEKTSIFIEIQADLLRFISKILKKLNSSTNKIVNGFEKNNKQIQNKILTTQSLLQNKFGKSYEQSIQGNQKKIVQQQSVLTCLNLQNTLLEKKVELYQSTLKEKFQQLTKESQNMQKYENTLHDILKQQQQKSQLKNELEAKKLQNEALMKQIIMSANYKDTLRMQRDKCMQQIKQLKKQIKQLQKLNKYRELWRMLNQQFRDLKQRYHLIKDQKNEAQSKLIHLKAKNKQLIKTITASNNININQQDDRAEIQQIIKNFKDWLKVISIPRVNIDLMKIKQQQEYFKKSTHEKLQLQQPQEIDFKCYRPNFYTFFETHQANILSEQVFSHYKSIQPMFYLKIRAIFDSMYTHFIFEHRTSWSTFPDFVVGFLEKFTINPIKRLPQIRKKSLSTQQRIGFLVDLFRKKTANTWQRQIFKQFLLEQNTLDEVYFFLDCRNELYQGPQLQRGFGSADPIVYVKLTDAQNLVKKKLKRYQPKIIERINNILILRRKIKNGHALIDSSFVLKILMQVYNIEKFKSQKIFKENFVQKDKICYGDFYVFVTKNFPYLSSAQVCSLYREIYFYSAGQITSKTIHYFCGVKGLFIPLLMSYRPPGQCDARSLSSDDMLILNIQNNTLKLQSYLQKNGLQTFGGMEKQINSFLRDTQWLRTNKSLFYQKYLGCIINAIRSKIYLDWQQSNLKNAPITKENITKMSVNIYEIQMQIDKNMSILLNNREKLDNAIIKITSSFKKRIQQSMQQFKIPNRQQMMEGLLNAKKCLEEQELQKQNFTQ